MKEAQHKDTGYNVAVKVYDKYKLIDDQRKRSVIKEIKLMRKMLHENIVQLYDAIDTQRQLYLIMENVEGQCMQQIMKYKQNRRFSSEAECAKVFV